MRRRLAFILVFCMILSTSALAASDLNAFEETHTYSSGMFSDVEAGCWYESGVRSVYAFGIMNGTGNGKFTPGQSITWAQAITIAARIHAACSGAEIPDASGQWYEAYLSYASQNSLLPSTCPSGADIAAREISRQELAGLFANVISADALPEINDQSIPDLYTVDSEFRSAVQRMYAAGIFTGKDKGNFDPHSSATRAEIAVIVSRLLLPGQRISHDSRANTAMAGQMGNSYQTGFAVQSGDTAYFSFKSTASGGDMPYSLIARNDDGSTETVFTSNLSSENLYLSEDGKIYFTAQDRLMYYDTISGTMDTVYVSKKSVEAFLIYDGKIYIFENYINSSFPDQWRYRFGYLENGKLKALMDDITFDERLYMNIHIFNNTAYFLFLDSTYEKSGYTFKNYALWSLDLETGEAGRIGDKDSFFCGELAFNGATAYALEKDSENGIPLRIVRFSLLQPEVREVLAVLPESANQLYSALFANGDDLYFESSGAQKLWHISKSGEVSLVSSAPQEYATVTNQGIVFSEHPALRLCSLSNLSVCMNDGSFVSYSDFLNMQ